MNRRSKKILTFTGFAVACVGLFFFILMRTNADAQQKAASSDTSSEIIMATPDSITVPDVDSKDTSSAFVPSSGAVASAPLTTVSKPTSTPPKPTPPASSALMNPSSKPAYSSKPTPKIETSQPSSSAVTKKSSSTVTRKPSTSSSATGNKTSGYDPIFGDKQGTGGQGTTVDGDWGGGSQVGIMD